MTRHPHRATALAVLAAAASLAVPAAAMAKGGGSGGTGGGGATPTAPKPGKVKTGGSAVAECSGGSHISLSVGKGRGSTIEEVLVMSGTTGGFWTFRTVEATSGRNVIGFGGNRTEQGDVSSVTTVQVNSWLPAGTWDLAFTGTRNELVPGGPIDATGALLETCTANLTIVVA